MASLIRWSGDGLSAGVLATTSIGTGDTAPDLVSGSLTVDASGPRAPRIRYTQAAGGNAYVRWSFASQVQSAFRFYWTSPSEWPSVTGGLLVLANSSGIGCRISLAGSGTPGVLRLYENPTASVLDATATNTLSVSTTYRIEGVFNQVNQTFEVKIFLGESNTPIDTLNGSSISAFGTSHTRMSLGNPNTTPTVGTFYIDDVALDSGTDYISSPWVNASNPNEYDVTWRGNGLASQAFTVATYGVDDTPADLVVGPVSVDSSGTRPPSLRMSQIAGDGCNVRWSFPARSESRFRFYWTTPAAWPSVSSTIMLLTDTSGVGARISMTGMGNPGALRLYENPAGSILDNTANGSLNLSTLYRIEGVLNQTAGMFEVRIYVGDTDQLIDTLFATSAAFGSTHERLVLGNVNATPLVDTMYFDDIVLDEGTTYLSTPYLTEAPITGDGWVLVGGQLFPIKAVAIKTTSGLTLIKRSSQAGGAPGTATNPFVTVSSSVGTGSATLNWSVTPGSASVEGVYVGRDGTSSSGYGPWESSLKTTPSGSQTFTNLVSGSTYLLYVDAVVDGKRVTHEVATVKIPSTVTTPAAYGGTEGWTLAQTINLTTEPTGTVYTNGVRTNTDQSYNRSNNAVFDSSGLTITAERASEGATIYSADVMMRDIVVPEQFAFEVDVTFDNLGAGRGPAVWFRPQSGEGELDLFEYCGGYIGQSNEMKSTIIKTGSNPYNQGSKAFGIPKTMLGGSFVGFHRWRYELTTAQAALWVDGQLVGTITKTSFESANGAGSWSQFSGNTQWYPRFTYQINNGAVAKLWGTVPSDWRSSTMRISAARIYGKN